MTFRALLISLLMLALLAPTAAAQEESPALAIRLNRDFGYGGFDNKIQGRFSIRVADASGFERIDFYIDDKLLESQSAEPFQAEFRTNDFNAGEHRIYALGYTSGGQEVRSNEYTRVFVSSEDVRDTLVGNVLPLVGILALIGVASAVLPRLIWRRKDFKLGDYGMAGGSICKECAKPFSRHVWMPNLIAGKLARCPHCGKWQIARRATLEELEAGEELLRTEGSSSMQASGSESEEERRIHRQIEDSRFD